MCHLTHLVAESKLQVDEVMILRSQTQCVTSHIHCQVAWGLGQLKSLLWILTCQTNDLPNGKLCVLTKAFSNLTVKRLKFETSVKKIEEALARSSYGLYIQSSLVYLKW